MTTLHGEVCLILVGCYSPLKMVKIAKDPRNDSASHDRDNDHPSLGGPLSPKPLNIPKANPIIEVCLKLLSVAAIAAQLRLRPSPHKAPKFWDPNIPPIWLFI